MFWTTYPMNCPYCGTLLQKTNWENLWCPNCGKIEVKTEDSEEKERTYIG